MRATRTIIEELHAEFERAEGTSKYFEHQAGKLPIPVVNELRYAGKHAVEALYCGLADSEEYRDLLDRALRHCKRARYDALEFLVVHTSEKLALCQETYSGYEWLAIPLIPDYFQHVKNVREAGCKLEAAHELDKESAAYVNDCLAHIKAIENFTLAIESAMPLIFSTMQHEKEKEQKEAAKENTQTKRSWWQLVVAAILGAGFAGLFSLLLG